VDLEEDSIDLEGCLEKLSSLRRWQKRKFVLSGQLLRYFKSDGTSISGAFDLSNLEEAFMFDKSTCEFRLQVRPRGRFLEERGTWAGVNDRHSSAQNHSSPERTAIKLRCAELRDAELWLQRIKKGARSAADVQEFLTSDSTIPFSDLILGRQLGQGAAGLVFAAECKGCAQQIAAKQVSFEDPGMVEEVSKEISMLRKLQHPNIIRLFGVSRDLGDVYILMELAHTVCVRGCLICTPVNLTITLAIAHIHTHTHTHAQDLNCYMGGNCKLPSNIGKNDISKWTNVMTQMCSGMAIIHEHSIIHRDLKPVSSLFGVRYFVSTQHI
jgi:hypothetical protein